MLKKVMCLKLLLRMAAINSIAATFSGVKSVLSVVFLLALLFTANVSQGFAVLWWAVGGDATVTDENNQTVSAGSYTHDGETIGAARIRITGNGVNTVLPLYMENEQGGWELSTGGQYTDAYTRDPDGGGWQGVDWAAAHVDLGGDTSQYSFVVELGSVDNTYSWQNTLAVSESYSYTELNKYFSESSVQAQDQWKWTVNSFTVPEPSVAMLLLLGAELLAFRRGRRKAVPRQRV